MNSLILRVSVLLSVLITICINAAANIIPFNNLTTGEVSDLYPTYFVPAGYVFSIWTVIYLGVIIFAFYQLKNRIPNAVRIQIWFIISCIANSTWIIAWHFGYIYVTVLLMAILLVSLLNIYRYIVQIPLHETLQYWCVHAPFSVYLGWVSIATIANVSAALYVAQWNGFGVSPQMWSVIMMAVGTILALFMLIKQRDLLYALVVIWAVIGIGVRFTDVAIINTTSYILAITISVFSIMVGARYFFHKKAL